MSNYTPPDTELSDLPEALYVDRNTIRTYYRKYIKGGLDKLLHIKHMGSTGFLSVSEANGLDEHLQENLHLTAKSVVAYIKRRWHIGYTERQRLHTNGAVNIDSLYTASHLFDPINGEATIDLWRAIEERYTKVGTIYVICDNTRYCRSKAVRQFLATSRIELVFLTPYASNLNLIERYWQYCKKEVLYDQYYETFKEFKKACQNFFSKPEKHVADLRLLLTENFQIKSA